MPLPQFVSPATIGDQLNVNPAVITDNGNLVLPLSGEDYTLIPSGTGVFPPGVYKQYTLTDATCLQPALHHTFGGEPWLLPLTIGDTLSVSQPLIYNYNSIVNAIGESSLVFGSSMVSPYKLGYELTSEFCPTGFSALPHFLGQSASDTTLVVMRGDDWFAVGDFDKIVSQFVYAQGASFFIPQAPKYVSSSVVYYTLDDTSCGGLSGLTHLFEVDRTTQLIFGRVFEDGKIPSHEVDTYLKYITPTGEIYSSPGSPAYVALRERQVKYFLNDASCPPLGSALQNAIGDFKGTQPSGVYATFLGDWSFIQGAPKILLSANDQTQIGGILNIFYPSEQVIFFSGGDLLSIGDGDVRNLYEVISIPPSEFTGYGDFTYTFREPPQPLGESHTDFGTFFISLFRRNVGPFLTGDTLGIPNNHWVSASPRFIIPDSSTLDGVGQGFVYERIFSIGEQLSTGTSYVFNLNRTIGPASGGLFTKPIPVPTIEYGTRYISDFPITASYFGLPFLWNASQFVYIQELNEQTKHGLSNIINANASIFSIPYDATVIPYTHLVHRNPYQQLHIGESHTEFGTSVVDFFDRFIYPQPATSAEVFNPNMLVEKQIVIAPVSHTYTLYGAANMFLLDLPYQMTQVETFSTGQMFISYLNRAKRVESDKYTDLGSVAIRNAAEYITVSGMDMFIQPWQTTYVDEHFTIIYPSIIPSTRYGYAFVENVNQEVFVGGSNYLEMFYTPDVSNYIRRIYPTPVTTLIGSADVRDALQTINFPNPTNHTYIGWPQVYLGQPWLPTNQIVHPDPIRRDVVPQPSMPYHDGYWIGEVDVSNFVRPTNMPGYKDDKYGNAEIVSMGILFLTQPTYTNLGFTTILGGFGGEISFTRDLPETKYGQARFSPDRIYMTGAVPVPNPYPGTDFWYAPDSTPHNPWSRRYKYGYLAVSNYYRTLFVQGYNHFGSLHYHRVEDTTILPHVIAPQGGKYEVIPFFGLLGGIRYVDFDFVHVGVFSFKSGTAVITNPIPPSNETVPFSGNGYNATLFGGTLVQNFIRFFNMPSVPESSEFGVSWLSFSPRYVTIDPTSLATLIGDAWTSFVVREVAPEGGVYSITLTYSTNDYNERLKVLRASSIPVDVNRLYPYDTDMNEVGTFFVKRGCGCE